MTAGRLRSVQRGRLPGTKRWLHRRFVIRGGVRPVPLLRGAIGLRRALLEAREIDHVALLLSRGWGNPEFAAAPELIAAVIRDVAGSRNAVVECGSGVTSVVLAAARKHLGTEVVTLEHDANWAATVERRLRVLGLHHDGVLVRPLENRDGASWYSVTRGDLPQRVGLAICDGPPASTRGGRMGILELLDRPWTPDVVLLDDTHRESERTLAEQVDGLGYSHEHMPASLGRSFARLTRVPTDVDSLNGSVTPASGPPMDIVFVAPECAPGEGLGRRGHYNEKVARLLARRGHSVTVLYAGAGAGERVVDAVRYVGMDLRLAERTPPAVTRRFDRPLRSIEFGLRCRRYIRSLAEPRPVVHVEVNGGAGVVVQVGSRVPTVLFLKGHMPTVNRLKHRRGAGQLITSTLEGLTFRTASTRYAPSDLVGRLYQTETRRRIRRIATPTDPSFDALADAPQSAAGPAPRFVFFTGTLEELKGVYLLAAAFAELVQRLPDATLTVIGRNTRQGGVDVREKMTSLLGEASERTRFVDFLSRADLADEIVRAGVVVLPSLFDNLPNALLESLQLGSLVVGTVGSSIDEVITDGVDGVLCAPTAPALLDAMFDAATRSDAATIRSNAIALAERFASDAVIPVLEDFLRTAAARQHPAAIRRGRRRPHARRLGPRRPD